MYGWFVISVASSAFGSPILCLAEHIVVVLLVVSCCRPTKVAAEARPRTVRKGCCVIGLAFERHVA